jgi:hypothetical protein
MSDFDPPELGNEDEGFLSLLDRAAANTGSVCLCSHPEWDHPGGECIRALCGCTVFRPGRGAVSWRAQLVEGGERVTYPNTYSTASRVGVFPAAGRSEAS